MKLLLDTHIWVWSLASKQHLSRRVTRLLGDARNELWISPISCWEVIVLARKGRLQLKATAHEWISAALKAGPFRPAVLTNEAVLAMTEIAVPHADPADTFLAATARIYGLTLVTADEQLAKGTGYSVLQNE